MVAVTNWIMVKQSRYEIDKQTQRSGALVLANLDDLQGAGVRIDVKTLAGLEGLVC